MSNNPFNDNETILRGQYRRYAELAAMFKEQRQGGERLKEKIISRFCLQEGLTKKKGNLVYEMLETSGLIIATSGHKQWRYNEQAEWDLFKIKI